MAVIPNSGGVSWRQMRPFAGSLGKQSRGGLPCVAECGGFQYLQERLQTAEGSYAMAGVLEGESFPAGSGGSAMWS